MTFHIKDDGFCSEADGLFILKSMNFILTLY